MTLENCNNCIYSENSELSLFFNEHFDNNCAVCNHINSPYYLKIINNKTVCRLFEDEKKYFHKKDRFEKIQNLNNKNKFGDF